MVDITVRIRADRRVRCVSTVNKKRVSIVVPDDISISAGVRDLVDVLRDLTEFRAILFVRLRMEQFIQFPQRRL